jgi:hypothetical protein
VQVSYDGTAPADIACALGASPATSSGIIAADHQAGMHRHIGSAISEALDRLRPLQEPHRVSTPTITAASNRASGGRPTTEQSLPLGQAKPHL